MSNGMRSCAQDAREVNRSYHNLKNPDLRTPTEVWCGFLSASSLFFSCFGGSPRLLFLLFVSLLPLPAYSQFSIIPQHAWGSSAVAIPGIFKSSQEVCDAVYKYYIESNPYYPRLVATYNSISQTTECLTPPNIYGDQQSVLRPTYGHLCPAGYKPQNPGWYE